MFSNEISIAQARPHGTPPSWSVRTVKCCVFGILGLPLAVPLLLAASSALGPGADPYRRFGFFLALAVWLGLFVTAQYLTTVFPPVSRDR